MTTEETKTSREVAAEYIEREFNITLDEVADAASNPTYTPRRRLEGTLTSIENRQSAARSMLNGSKQGKHITTYLKGYYDALELVTAELRQCKDAEIMSVTPGSDGGGRDE